MDNLILGTTVLTLAVSVATLVLVHWNVRVTTFLDESEKPNVTKTHDNGHGLSDFSVYSAAGMRTPTVTTVFSPQRKEDETTFYEGLESRNEPPKPEW